MLSLPVEMVSKWPALSSYTKQVKTKVQNLTQDNTFQLTNETMFAIRHRTQTSFQ